MSSRSYSQRDLKLLFGLSAMRCAYPGCRTECYVEAEAESPDRGTIIGKISHIVASSDDGPRADPRMPNEDRDKYENLILLCGIHHDIVDGQENTYTITVLQQWKQDHEEWVRQSFEDQIPGIGFAELEIITKALLASESLPEDGFRLIPPREKMQRNELSNNTGQYLTMGLVNAPEVASYIEEMVKFDNSFPDNLKAGFVAEYQRQWEDDLRGDALFFAMLSFASRKSRDFRLQTAGLAVLSHLFSTCDVFET